MDALFWAEFSDTDVIIPVRIPHDVALQVEQYVSPLNRKVYVLNFNPATTDTSVSVKSKLHA